LKLRSLPQKIVKYLISICARGESLLHASQNFNRSRIPAKSDLDLLRRIKVLSRLSAAQIELLAGALTLDEFDRDQTILRDAEFTSNAHILIKGIARITCKNARGERVTIALLPAGPIPNFPSLPSGRFDFCCEAYNDCRIGSLYWDDFNKITANSPELVRTFHQNDMRHWYRLLLRSSRFLKLDLRERVAITLLELAADFGIEESRGVLLKAPFSHNDIADLVGASRPRVTEHLAQLESEHLLVRQDRTFIVRVDELERAIGIPPSSRISSGAYPPGK
jgi:CRP/FNR family cyclic AMP-dependent transcriptional regulator